MYFCNIFKSSIDLCLLGNKLFIINTLYFSLRTQNSQRHSIEDYGKVHVLFGTLRTAFPID